MIRQYVFSFVIAGTFIVISAGQAFSTSHTSVDRTGSFYRTNENLPTETVRRDGGPKKSHSKLNRGAKTKAISYSNHSVKKGNWKNTRKIVCSVNDGLKSKKNWKKTSPAPVNERKKTTRVYQNVGQKK
ncbi:MAG TPA: hypothetical protein PKN48_06535 [Bacteroidales bacterium]|nr:hypothetical protein [Bacteroidales bacterium]